MDRVITKLNKIGKNYIDGTFSFDNKKDKFVYKSVSKRMSHAINLKKNRSEQVSVINWFEDIWLYIELKYILISTKPKKEVPNIFFTLSIFQGESKDIEKTQLFRAEWDNYETPSNNHPQPHWHIYTQKDIVRLKKTFTELIDSTEDNFESFIKSDKINIDIERFHFAMNGQWSENNSDIHKITTENNLTSWFAGIINHIKKELEYLKVK